MMIHNSGKGKGQVSRPKALAMPITIPYQNGFQILAKAQGQGLRQKEKDNTVSILASAKGQKNRGASFGLHEASSNTENGFHLRIWNLV